MNNNHMIIGDTQVKPGVSLDYIDNIGKLIVRERPKVLVMIGDFADFESLSSYDKGKLSFEGRRLKDDINVCHEAMRRLLAPLAKLQCQQKKNKKRVYNPRMILTLGNHEDRFDRLVRDNPEMEGFAGTDTLDLESYGWEVYPYLQPVEVDGITYVHYLANPFTGKPYGGTAHNQLKHVGKSFVVGHKQTLDIAFKPVIDGTMQIGIINGACYDFYEDYKGPTGNNHPRGLVVLDHVKNGFGDLRFISLSSLR